MSESDIIFSLIEKGFFFRDLQIKFNPFDYAHDALFRESTFALPSSEGY
jgi:hypothetical protein